MSLLVWLPLTDDLRDRGLSNATFKAGTGVEQYDQGKIGKCYYLNGKTLSSSGFTHLQGTTDFSVCCWVKFTKFPSSSNAYCICLNNASSSTYKFVLGIYSTNGTTASFRLNLGSSVGTLNLNTWYHLAICVSGTTGYMYLNGALVKTVNNISQTDCTNLVIGGRSSNAAGTTFTGTGASAYYNDVRIYNHCLTPREIKYLSWGLILHLPLKDDLTAGLMDCSGYGRHGSIVGTLTSAENSARYEHCIYFADGRTNYARSGIFTMPTDAITMSCWFKSTTTGYSNYHIPLSFNGSHYEFSVDSTGKFRNGFMIDGVRVVDNAKATLLDNQWHMLTATYDGATIRRYVDGVEVANSSHAVAGTLSGGSGNLLLGNYNGTTYGNKEAYMSDVRIYATALNENDIKLLYQTRISMFENGTLHAYEYKECNVANTKLKENGVIETNGIDEIGYIGGMLIKVLSDGSAWARINWLDLTSEKVCFADVNEVAFCDQPNRFSQMGLVDHFKNTDGIYEFRLVYPRLSTTLCNHWTQTSSPNAPFGSETGLVKIQTDYEKHSGALVKITSSYASSAVYACNTAGNWWAPIGQMKLYNSAGTPAANGTMQTETELWVRIENLATLNKISMLDNKYIQAFDIYEI